MRIIPKNTKVQIKFYKGITLSDIIVGIIILSVVALIAVSNLPNRAFIMLGVICLSTPLFLSMSGERLYISAVYILRHLFSRKSYSGTNTQELFPHAKIFDGYIANKDGSFVGVLEIKPMEFGLLGEHRQNFLIDGTLTNALCAIGAGQSLSIIKVDKLLNLDKQVAIEERRKESLKTSFEKGDITEAEYTARMEILEDRLALSSRLNDKGEIRYSGYYLTLYDNDQKSLRNTLEYIWGKLRSGGIEADVLDKQGLEEFIKLSINSRNGKMPKNIEFRMINTTQDKQSISHLAITQYPLKVYNAWGNELFDIPNTKITYKLKPVEKGKAIRRIDTAINELAARTNGKASMITEQSTHIETLSLLLTKLQNDNEALFDTTLIVTVYDKLGKNTNKRTVKRKLRELGFSYNEMPGRQTDAYLSAGITAYDKVKISRGIQASGVAAAFPFCSNAIIEDSGILIGENKLPVYVDFFKRDNEHVNSNMVIVGKPGSGKSFATKTLLSNLAADGAKIFVLDPEAEYLKLTQSLKGKVLDVSGPKHGIINPFQIIASLEDENEDETNNGYYAHLQFLEQFYKAVFEGLNSDCLELLNKLTIETYRLKGIKGTSSIDKLSPNSYPTFENLAKTIDDKLKDEEESHNRSCYTTLQNYVAKFRSGGRYSALWNGKSSLETDENIVCFNFQKLLANKNDTVANAQMLLILKWLENEVIRNREYNMRHKTSRKIIVVVDEAHLFIDEKYPVALDFMFQLAKRIRKYDGMQIVITQNIKDFAGTPEIARKSTAIINVSQYSLIFSLSPNDMTDLCKLYEKAGEINESEQECIIYNPRGCAFLISSPQSRTNIKIAATPHVENLFS